MTGRTLVGTTSPVSGAEDRAVFATHESVSDYVAALSAYSGVGPVPLLGPATRTHAVVAGMSSDDARRPVQDAASAVVVVRAGSASEDCAHALAAACGARVVAVDDIKQAVRMIDEPAPARYVVWVGLAGELSEADLTALHENLHRVSERRGSAVHLGVLTGRDLAELSWVIAKGLAFPRRSRPEMSHLRVWPAATETPMTEGPGRWVLADEAVAEVVGPLVTTHHSSLLSFFDHGRDNVLHLADTVICSFEPVHRDRDPSGDRKLPACAYTGRCFRPDVDPELIIRADRILADVVFANGCNTGRLADGLYEHDYLLTYSILAGAPAVYVSSHELSPGVVKVNDLFHLAMRRGATAGEATTIINDHVRSEGTDYPHFTAYGLPWLTLAEPDLDPVTGLAVVTGHDAAAGPDGRVAAGLADLAETRAVAAPTTTVHLTARSHPLFGDLPRQQAAGTDVDGLRGELRRLGDAVLALRDLELIGIDMAADSGTGTELLLRSARLAAMFDGAASLGDPARIGREMQRLAESVRAAEDRLAGRLFERGTTTFLQFSHLWLDLLERPLVELDGASCPYCARLVARPTMRHPLFGRIARDCQVCARCRVLSDLDVNAPIDQLTIVCPEFWYQRSTVQLELAVTAKPTASQVEVVVGALAPNGLHNNLRFPEPQRVTVEPGETARVRLAVDIGIPDRYLLKFLQAFAIADGTACFASRPIWLTR